MFVIIGSVTADLLVQSDTPLADLGGDGFRSSNLVFTDAPLTVSMGGNGGNSAFVLAGLGAPTALCGAVGQDLLGDTLAGWLTERGVDISGLARSPQQATSTSTIVMTDTENQAVFHHLGSTASARFEAMPPGLFADAQALLLSSYPILAGMRPEGSAQALARVQAAGGITALDVGPAIGPPVTLAELAPLLPAVDYLLANVHELCALVPEAADGMAGVPDAAARLLAAGARHVLVKRGAQGATAFSADGQMQAPGFPVAANVSVGAGDSFNVGLLYGLGQGWPLPRALRFANGLAALVVASPRGVLDAPSLAQVEQFLDSAPKDSAQR